MLECLFFVEWGDAVRHQVGGETNQHLPPSFFFVPL